MGFMTFSRVAPAGACAVIIAGVALSEDGASTDRPPLQSGTELVAILFISSTCPGATDPRLPEAWEVTTRALQSYADSSDRTFVTIGAALDLEATVGLSVLGRFGSFDEVHAGRQHLNTAALRYMQEFHGSGALPQIVLVERTAKIRGGLMGVSGERVLVRKTGSETITSWARELHRFATTELGHAHSAAQDL